MPARRIQTVLVVDDEESIRGYLASVLRFEGYECRCFDQSRAALAYLSAAQEPADLMLADISMPGMGGMELLREAKALKPEMPVILVSGLYELALALDALESGADDYLKKPVRPSDVITLVRKYLHQDLGQQQAAIEAALTEYIASRRGDPKTSEHIQSIFQTLGFRRYETFQHSKRVAAYCRLLAERCGVPAEQLDRIELGALLHDIGKIGIPRNVLLKPGKLSEEEWKVMRVHPTIGYRLMARFDELNEEAELIYDHHERFDGAGYPRGLEGEAIPVGARLFAIVDALDAITSDRPYRAGASFAKAREEIVRMSGTQFDPKPAEVFLSIPDQDLERIRLLYPDQVGDEEEVCTEGAAEFVPQEIVMGTQRRQ